MDKKDNISLEENSINQNEVQSENLAENEEISTENSDYEKTDESVKDENSFIEEDINNPNQGFKSVYFEGEYKREKSFFDKIPNYFFSGFFMRAFAYIVDSLVISAVSEGVLGITGLTYFVGDIGLMMFKTLFLSLYFTIFTYLSNGQTLGKMIFGLRVIEETGERLRLSTAIIREFFGKAAMKFIPVLYLLVIFTPKKQHLFDMLADTSVITENYFFAARDYKNII